MAYSIESTTARRCTTNLNGQQCGLAEHHADDHVAPDGRQRWSRSIFAPPTEAWGDRIGGPRAGQKVTADNVSESVAAVLADRISAVAQRVESETPLREALKSRIDQLTNKLNQEQHNRHRLADQVTALMNRVTALERDYVDPARANGLLDRIHKLDTALVDMRTDLNREKKAREALTVELVNTRRARVSPLEDRVTKLEVDGVHQLKKRFDTLERDLRDTHDLAERVATAHLERKPEAPVPDTFQRCDVSVPKQCVLQRGHGGHSHVSNSGTMWPVDDRRTLLPIGEERE